MALPANFEKLTGTWAGTNKLWLSQDEPPRTSESTMQIATAAQGRFLLFRYTWADDGKPHDGVLLLGADKGGAVRAQWVDSFHMGDAIMALPGMAGAGGTVRLKGTYPAPPDPDWGWWIDLEPPEGGAFTLRMHNVTPDGKAELAVEATYTRKE